MKNMHADPTKLRVQCVPPTKEYFSVVLVPIVGGLIVSILSDPHQWFQDTALAVGMMMALAAVWFWGFVPHQSNRIYIVDSSSLGIERSGKIIDSVPWHEIESVSDMGAAVRITRVNSRPILLYPGEEKDALLHAIRATPTNTESGRNGD